MSAPDSERPPRTGRRAVVAAASTGLVGWFAGSRLGHGGEEPAPAPRPGRTQEPAAALTGADLRPGITAPATPQRSLRLTVVDLPGVPAPTVLERVRTAVAAVPAAPPDAGTVTVTVGFGARLARALWPERATADMSVPGFAHDVPGLVGGGDLSVQVCAETAAAAGAASTAVLAALGRSRTRWGAVGHRDAPTPEGTTRTPSGFIDGIINPREPDGLREGVWVGESGRDTYVVYRRMEVAHSFSRLDVEAQEQAVGRRRTDGAPLSGGGTMDEIDLFAKTPQGRPLVPAGAHARRAHPSNLGLPLMLRRSYATDTDAALGLVFTAFMNDPQTFVATQRRLDVQDDFLAHSSADAIGMFFVPEL